MRANTSRELRLAFDSTVAQYDAGRPLFDSGLVDKMMAWAGLHPGAVVLEVGAGTGQLTTSLMRAGLHVVALEPGPNMATHLRQRFQDGPGFTVEQSLFEDYEAGEGRFAAIVSANAFHWIDPAVSYAKADRLLMRGGSLALIWNFPILADADLQRRLNDDAFTGELADFRREPEGYVETLPELLAGGRDELMATGLFDEPRWELGTEPLLWTTDRYIAFLSSLANGVALAGTLNRRARSVLGDLDEISIANHVYLGVARRTDLP